MEEQKLVLQDGTYKYDDKTRQVSVSEEELKKAGYVKLADDEQVVKKVELSEEEAKFMKENKSLVRFSSLNECFEDEASEYAFDDKRGLAEVDEIYRRLSKAYYNGYTVKKETKYYIKFPSWQGRKGKTYLNVDNDDGEWLLTTKIPLGSIQSQFTQKEIDAMQQDERAKGLDLNALKVKVPDDELKD